MEDDPAARLEGGRVAPVGRVQPQRREVVHEVGELEVLAVAVPGRLVGVAPAAPRHPRADGVEEAGDRVGEERIALEHHLRAVDLHVLLAGGLQRQVGLGDEGQGPGGVLEALGRHPAASVVAQHRVGGVEPGPGRVAEVVAEARVAAPGVGLGRVVGLVQGHGHQREVAHVGREVVVDRVRAAASLATSAGSSSTPPGRRSSIPVVRGSGCFLGPAEEHLADGAWSPAEGTAVDPVDGQGERLARPPRPVVDREARLGEHVAGLPSRVDPRSIMCIRSARDASPTSAPGRDRPRAVTEREQEGVALAQLGLVGAHPGVGDDAAVVVASGLGDRDRQRGVDRVRLLGPRPQAGQIVGADPQPRMAGGDLWHGRAVLGPVVGSRQD